MMRHVRKLLTLALVGMVLSGSTAAIAQTTESIAETGAATVSLVVMGLDVELDVTLDEFGVIDTVEVSEGFTVDKEKDTKVRFVSDDEATRVEVKAKGKKLETKVKAAGLSDLLGTHTWTGDVFGTGDRADVTFSVVEGPDGYPEIVDVVVGGALPAGTEVTIREFDTDVDDDDDHGEAKDKAEVRFMYDGYKKRLKIEVEVESDHGDDDDDDHDFGAKLKVELVGKDRRELVGSLEDFIGTHMWEGLLCDGTPVSVTYTVTDDGKVELENVTGVDADGYDVKQKDHKLEVKFDGTKARVKIELKDDDGDVKLKVDSKTTETCKKKKSDDDDDDDHKKKSDDDDDDHDDDHKKKDDDDDHGDDDN